MKLTVSCLCILHVAFVSAELLTSNDLQASNKSLTDSKAQVPQSAASFNHDRHRPLFARRGQYERQRIHVPKPKVVPVPLNDPPRPPKVVPSPVKPNCSRLTQTCLPQFGCCEPCASCHCRFFNAICFCRKTNSLCEKKT